MKKILIGSLLIFGFLGTLAARKTERMALQTSPVDTVGFVPRPASVDVADLQELLEKNKCRSTSTTCRTFGIRPCGWFFRLMSTSGATRCGLCDARSWERSIHPGIRPM